VLPGLVIEETGSGEISGAKYMKEAIGFPGKWSRPTSNRMVGPVATPPGKTTAGRSVWLSAGNRLFVQTTSTNSRSLALIATACIRQGWGCSSGES
jgi:hypothetical protein